MGITGAVDLTGALPSIASGIVFGGPGAKVLKEAIDDVSL